MFGGGLMMENNRRDKRLRVGENTKQIGSLTLSARNWNRALNEVKEQDNRGGGCKGWRPGRGACATIGYVVTQLRGL